ncbi:MAG: phosphoribosyltransferase [Pseudomonadales bacterium RIFCSPLOWO2_12_59_9]|nr:MAG: phosphoribosyltransferase [Pseudomonadales bacterium RIFCSPLOWO2_12_59_9]
MQATAPSQRLCLYCSAELEPVIARMASQAISLLPGGRSVLVAMLRRGEPLARMLQQQIMLQSGQAALPIYPLKVKRYADDLTLLHAETALTESPELAALDLQNTALLVVDDVLYQGHSLLRTCAYLARLGAREIRTAVLVDRCISQQPVHADIIGLRLQIAGSDVIECNVPPYEADFRIDLLRRGPSGN